jgi:glycerol-3-phosphate O-acyltransferase/dihydroxyacetone phosphate acyltransferase
MGVEKKGTMMSELDYTKAQLAFFYIIVLLSLDVLNPVKIFLHVFPAVAPWHVAALSIGCLVYIFIVNMRELLYFSVKVFFHSILSIFFNDIQVVGRENIPEFGPVIFTSNHANQFMDGTMIMCTCQRNISYLMAEKSWQRPIIGHLAWAMGAVPVKRAQDSAVKGSGSVSVDVQGRSASEIKVIGRGTTFTAEIKVGDKIRFPQTAQGVKVASIDDDESMTLMVENGVLDIISSQPFPDFVNFDILPRIDQNVVYQNVLEKLASGGTIGLVHRNLISLFRPRLSRYQLSNVEFYSVAQHLSRGWLT